jgi:hypothetical protein
MVFFRSLFVVSGQTDQANKATSRRAAGGIGAAPVSEQPWARHDWRAGNKAEQPSGSKTKGRRKADLGQRLMRSSVISISR